MKQALILLIIFACQNTSLEQAIQNYQANPSLQEWGEFVLGYMLGVPYPYKSKLEERTVKYWNPQTDRYEIDHITTSETVFYSLTDLYPTYTRRIFDPNSLDKRRWILVDGMWVSRPYDDYELPDPNTTMNRTVELIEKYPDDTGLKSLLELIR